MTSENLKEDEGLLQNPSNGIIASSQETKKNEGKIHALKYGNVKIICALPLCKYLRVFMLH